MYVPMNGKLIDGKYHYDPQWLEEFHKRGREHGDAGFIPISFDGKMTTYEGYGTIENPCKNLRYITIMYNPVFDGPLFTPSTDEPGFSFGVFDFSKL